MISYMELLKVIRESRIRLSQGFRQKRATEHRHSYDYRRDVWKRCLEGWLSYCNKLAEVEYGHVAISDDDPGDCNDGILYKREIMPVNGARRRIIK